MHHADSPEGGRRLPGYLRHPRVWIVLAFLGSRILYYLAGVRFDASPLDHYWQLVDQDLLRTRLWESLLHLHMQPPGFNFLAGVVLKLFPDSPAPALHVIQMTQGLLAALCVAELMDRMGVRRRIALPMVILFIVSPGILLFENLFIYDYLSLAQLLLTSVLLYRFADQPSLGRGVAFQGSMLAMMLVRNGFHLPYYLLLIAGLALYLKPYRKLVAQTAAIPLLVVVSLHVKNWVLFGQFTASTWHGTQMAFVSTIHLTEEEARDLYERKIISGAALLGVDAPLANYAPYLTMPAPTGIGVLDRPEGKYGRPNFNHKAQLELQGVFLADAKAVLSHFPKAYWRSLTRAWFCYFLPLGDFPHFGKNYEAIGSWDRLFNTVVFGQLKPAQPRRSMHQVLAKSGPLGLLQHVSIYLLVGLPLLFFWGLWQLWTGVRSGKLNRAQTVLLGFVLYNIASLTTLFNFLASFDNNRYRLTLDGYFILLAGMALTVLTTRKTAETDKPRIRLGAATD